MCKLIHTSIVEKKDHGTTGVSPAEMLFNRKLQTKLPRVSPGLNESKEMRQIRESHDNKKLQQKQYFDKARKAKPKSIKVGNEVLIQQEKSTTKPPFDPKPYTVTAVKGNKIYSTRSDATRVRDKNQVKKVTPRNNSLKPCWEKNKPNTHNEQTNYTQFEIEGNFWKDPRPTHVEQPENHSETVENMELFDINNETAAQMEALLVAANTESNAKVNTSRVTRSKGTELQWNPYMNDGPVVIAKT